MKRKVEITETVGLVIGVLLGAIATGITIYYTNGSMLSIVWPFVFGFIGRSIGKSVAQEKERSQNK